MKIIATLLGMIYLLVPIGVVIADGTSSCGIGAKMWKGNTGLTAHSSAESSNTSNDFSITSGTSGCDASKTVQLEKKQEAFLASNFEILTEEISRGKGEHLVALAILMGCPKQAHQKFTLLMKQQYSFYYNDNKSPNQMINQTKHMIYQNNFLSRSCN
jgi:hypothetical protein